MGNLHVIEVCTDEFEVDTGVYVLVLQNWEFSLTPDIVGFCEEHGIDIVPGMHVTEFAATNVDVLRELDDRQAAQ